MKFLDEDVEIGVGFEPGRAPYVEWFSGSFRFEASQLLIDEAGDTDVYLGQYAIDAARDMLYERIPWDTEVDWSVEVQDELFILTPDI